MAHIRKPNKRPSRRSKEENPKKTLEVKKVVLLRTVKVDQFNRIVSNLIGTPLDQEVK